MDMKYLSPIVVIKSLFLLIFGRVRFIKENVEQKVTVNGQDYEIFRHTVLKKNKNPQGVFCVWFHTKMSTQKTIILSYFTMIGFIGFPGWCSKKWLIYKKTGDLGGIYGFETIEDAKKYQNSYAMKYSKWRSEKGKFNTCVFTKQKFPYQNMITKK